MLSQIFADGQHLTQGTVLFSVERHDIPSHLTLQAYQGRKAHRGGDEVFATIVAQCCKTTWRQAVEDLCEEGVVFDMGDACAVALIETLIDAQRWSRILAIDEAGVERRGIVGDGARVKINRSFLVGHLAQHGLHLGFPLFGVDVANDGDKLEVGTIPRVVETLHIFGFELLQNLRRTDDVALGVACIVVKHRIDGIVHTLVDIVATTPLLEYDAALFLHIGREHLDAMTPVGQEEEHTVGQCSVGCWDIVHRIAGFVFAGEGFKIVEIVGAQESHHTLGKMLGGVEREVFKHVCQTFLPVVFEDSTDILIEVELSFAGCTAIVADVVGQAVGKRTCAQTLDLCASRPHMR